MKVLFVSTLYHPNAVGGAEATVKMLAEGLVRTGDDAVVVSLAPDGRPADRIVEGVHAHYVPLFNVHFPWAGPGRPAWRRAVWTLLDAFNPVMARRVGKLVDREQPDLVHVHNLGGFSCAIWPALARRGVPLVQTLHDHYAVCSNSVMYRRGRNCARRCLHCRVLCAPRARLSRKIDAVTTVSAYLWQRISASGAGAFAGVAQRRVIHNCNADSAPVPVAIRPDPAAPLRIGYLGRLEPIKGIEVLLEAAERIGPQRARVRVGGTGLADYESRLKARFAGPSVEFLGRVTPADFFAGIDVLVVPSLVEEALGRVVHEAFSFGVPVVGVSIGGIPEMIREGVTGFLVPAGDAGALHRLMERLIDAPPDWRLLSAACLKEAERFSFNRIFGEYRGVWRAALAARDVAEPSAGGGPARLSAPAEGMQGISP